MFPLVNYFQKLQLKVPPLFRFSWIYGFTPALSSPLEKWENCASLAGSHTATRTIPVFLSQLQVKDSDLRGLDFELKLGPISEAYICRSICFLEQNYRWSLTSILPFYSLKVPFLAR